MIWRSVYLFVLLIVAGCGGPRSIDNGARQAIGGYVGGSAANSNVDDSPDVEVSDRNENSAHDTLQTQTPQRSSERVCRSVKKPAPAECQSEDFYVGQLAKCGAGYVAKFCKSVVNKEFADLTSDERLVARHISAQSCMSLANNLTGKGVTGGDVFKTATKQVLSDSGETGKFVSDMWTHGEALYCSLNVITYCSERHETECD